VLQAHLDGRTRAYETEHRLARRDGGYCWVLDRGRVIDRDPEGRPTRMCGTHLDISERRRIEEHLQGVAKMEALGRLAGGVAHDLNNLLTPILGYADLLTVEAHHGEQRQAADEILRAGRSARDLVRRLLAFGRKQHLRRQPVDLNATVADFENLLRHTIPASITIQSSLTADLPPVLADAGQLEQILMNLAVNAADAMPEGGRLEIATALAAADAADAGAPRMLELRVRDTGRGMTAEVRERAFEPFFSTKGEHGTGLGLSTVHGIVRQHGGSIRIASEPGRGTTIEILLPIATDAPVAPTRSIDAAPPRGNGETVLLVEDDDMVRQLARAVLERQGYRVLVAMDGTEALERLEQHEASVALLLADVVMPGLNGRQLLDRARQRRPDLRALFMSGYAADVLVTHGAGAEELPLLLKPFSTHELAREVRLALDRPGPGMADAVS
jgi:signal transduction histidine kinase